jgi:hypothetical protein
VARKFRADLANAPEHVQALVNAVTNTGRRGNKTLKWRELVLAWKEGGFDHSMFKVKESLTSSSETKCSNIAMTRTMMMATLNNDKTLLAEGLASGDIVEVEHPNHPGKVMYKHTVYSDNVSTKASTKVTLKKEGERSVDAPSLQDTKVHWGFQNAGAATGGSTSTGAGNDNAIPIGSAGDALPLEDATSGEKLALKAEEHWRKCDAAMFKAEKTLAALPADASIATEVKEKVVKALALAKMVVHCLKHWCIHQTFPEDMSRDGNPDINCVHGLVKKAKIHAKTLAEGTAMLAGVVPKKRQ